MLGRKYIMRLLSNYVKIGRAPLIQLIGLQPNYKKTEMILDSKESGCDQCPYSAHSQYHTPSGDKCKYNCPKAVYKEKTVYVNERNI